VVTPYRLGWTRWRLGAQSRTLPRQGGACPCNVLDGKFDSDVAALRKPDRDDRTATDRCLGCGIAVMEPWSAGIDKVFDRIETLVLEGGSEVEATVDGSIATQLNKAEVATMPLTQNAKVIYKTALLTARSLLEGPSAGSIARGV
jgi:hypothetical protein